MRRTPTSSRRTSSVASCGLLGLIALALPLSGTAFSTPSPPQGRGGRLPSTELRERFDELEAKWEAGLEKLRDGQLQGHRREASRLRLRESLADDFRTHVRLGGKRSAVWLLATASEEERADPDQLSERLTLYRRAMEDFDRKWLARSDFVNALVADGEGPLGYERAHEMLAQLDRPDAELEVRASLLLGHARLQIREAAHETDAVQAGALRERATRSLVRLMSEYPDTAPARRGEGDLWRVREMLPGRQAPEFVSTDIEGNEYSLEDLEGQVVLLHFFSFDSWGVHHQLERDAQLIERYWDANFVLLGVNRDSDRSRFRRRVDRADIDWPVVWEGESELSTAEAWHMPRGATVLIDRMGRIVAVDPSPERLQDFLDGLVRDKAAPVESEEPVTGDGRGSGKPAKRGTSKRKSPG